MQLGMKFFLVMLQYVVFCDNYFSWFSWVENILYFMQKLIFLREIFAWIFLYLHWQWGGMNAKLISNFQFLKKRSNSTHTCHFPLQQYFSHPRILIYFLPSLTHKYETKIVKRQNLLKTNHPNQLIYVTNQE